MSETGWDLPDPYIHRIAVTEADMDAFGHANNARYLEWADAAAWTHWWSKGYSMDACQTEDRGIAIIRLDDQELGTGAKLDVECTDGVVRTATVCELPMYDKAGDIPRGRAADSPEFPGVIA